MFTSVIKSNWAKFFAVVMQFVAYPFFLDYVFSKARWLTDKNINLGWFTDFLNIFRLRINLALTPGYIVLTLFEGFVFYYARLAYNTFYPLIWAEKKGVKLSAEDFARLQNQAKILVAMLPIFLGSLYICYYDIHATYLGLTTGTQVINGEVVSVHMTDGLTLIFMGILSAIITLSTEVFLIFSKNFAVIELLFDGSSFANILAAHSAKTNPASEPAAPMS
jgi:hypothetical protein